MEDQSQNFNGVLKKASLGKGLTPEETRCLLERAGPADWSGLMALAKRLTVENFHSKIFLFAPLYFSNHCVNDCLYCGFRRSNEQVKRHALSVEAFVQEARILWERGHRTLLLVAGEHPDHADARHLGPYLWGLRDAGLDFSVGIEIGPAESHDYRFLKDLGVNRCVLYQETYDPATYRKMHPPGPKTDFDWRYRALSR
ncbi:MAG: radical SAM protein, partial [Candidatus Omnitrophota bacterium]